jgi:hypothetical protein
MKYFCVVLFLLTCNAVNATAELRLYHDTTVSSTADTTDTVIRKMSISAGVVYGSDVQFFGRTGPITYPFVSTDVIYNTKNGFFAYASALKVLGYNPLFDEIDLGAGYLYKISKQFSGTASYTRFLFNRDAAQVIKSASANDINLKNTFDWKFAKSSIVLDYLFGNENDVFVTINTTKHFESSFNIFDDKDYLTLDPTITAILGTQNFVERYAMDHQYQMQQNNIFFSNPNDPHQARDNSQFNALNYNIKIPIAYNRPHYTFEFSYKYSIPVNVEGALMNRHESFYNLTFYYVFY